MGRTSHNLVSIPWTELEGCCTRLNRDDVTSATALFSLSISGGVTLCPVFPWGCSISRGWEGSKRRSGGTASILSEHRDPLSARVQRVPSCDPPAHGCHCLCHHVPQPRGHHGCPGATATLRGALEAREHPWVSLGKSPGCQ